MTKGVPKLTPQPWPTHGWEYLDLELSYEGSWENELNEQGRDGWQVVSVIHHEDAEGKDDSVRVLLMRPRDKQWRKAKPEGTSSSPASDPKDDEEEEDDDGQA